ncbi:YhcH/YjgK/YiaL family protein [Sulfurimonas sp.]|uniref:YhcH/YjgK/YiaL family protein n=1 Tax=Sulfurimonas sp. TaxID=2022749 RepID=UPI0025E87EB3|nr:YhcH/YjgK/YiaL family protein [Sulfurimonas sp.]MDD5157100.1 YhcH/YjgK/YiaL family protein [Sulfurimonas sp.]
MIIDKLQNAKLYYFGSAWERAFEFLNSLTPDTLEGKYVIDGEDIFAIIMSYETTVADEKIFESHREYVDIQSVIVGSERFECDFADALEVETPYDTLKEAAFYRRNIQGRVIVDIYPETFLMLYPNDAHLAGVMIGDSSKSVKKVVVKIRKSLLEC